MTLCGPFQPYLLCGSVFTAMIHSHLLTAEQEDRAEPLPKVVVGTHGSIESSSQNSHALLHLCSGTNPIYEARKPKLTSPFLTQRTLPWVSTYQQGG